MNKASKRRVLIVEDERIVAMDLQETLSELGYDALAIASSAEEAVARCTEVCPDVVLMDIRIKGARDGIETAAMLRKDFQVPVIFLTAHVDDATLERAKATEPHGYLTKPVRAAELRSSIEVAIHKHQMERRLEIRERWFSTTLASIADAVIAVDLGGSVTFMNAAAEMLTGVTVADGIGQSAASVLRLLDLPAGTETPLVAALRGSSAIHLEQAQLLNLGTGAQRTINDSAAPVLDEGRTLGAVMVFRDVTEQKKLQLQLELADRLTSLGTMAAGVAHELNNPLSVVVANAGLLAKEVAVRRAAMSMGSSAGADATWLGDVAEALRDVQSAASRMGRIVAELGAFARPVPVASESSDLRRCVEWAVRATSQELIHRAEVVLELGDAPRVRGDETRLGQVLVNLMINAAHAIAPGKVEQNRVTVTTRRGADGAAILEVRDTGTGIHPELLSKVFDPFVSTKPVGEGTGLGLSICHGIVRSLGGTIEVESQVGVGTTFRVVLPGAPAATSPPHAAVAPGSSSASLRILAIDDEEMILRVIKRALPGCEIVGRQRAREALALLESGERFDVILCDLTMPSMTGIEFYEALLAKDPELARSIVIMSGGAITASAAEFLTSITNSRLEKPFEHGTLVRTVEEVAQRNRQRS